MEAGSGHSESRLALGATKQRWERRAGRGALGTKGIPNSNAQEGSGEAQAGRASPCQWQRRRLESRPPLPCVALQDFRTPAPPCPAPPPPPGRQQTRPGLPARRPHTLEGRGCPLPPAGDAPTEGAPQLHLPGRRLRSERGREAEVSLSLRNFRSADGAGGGEGGSPRAVPPRRARGPTPRRGAPPATYPGRRRR